MIEFPSNGLSQTNMKKIEKAEELLACSDKDAVSREILRKNGFHADDDNKLKQNVDPIHTQRIIDAMDLLSEISVPKK